MKEQFIYYTCQSTFKGGDDCAGSHVRLGILYCDRDENVVPRRYELRSPGKIFLCNCARAKCRRATLYLKEAVTPDSAFS